MSKAMVIILLGSKSDRAHALKIATELKEYEIEYVSRIGSAHKTPEHVLAMIKEYESDNQPKIYIAIAGRSNALGGFLDGKTMYPVITCPPPSDSFGGKDIYSSLRMPSGIAPAVVLEPKNAAMLAAKIVALFDENVFKNLYATKMRYVEKIFTDDAEIVKNGL